MGRWIADTLHTRPEAKAGSALATLADIKGMWRDPSLDPFIDWWTL